MARMRSIKPEYWADEDMADLPRDARLLYVGLWNLADEHGRLRGDPRYVKGQLFPYDDDLPPAAVDILLNALTEAGKVIRYRSGGGRYLFLPKLAKHQRLDAEKVPSRLPSPEESDLDSSAPESGKFPDESARGDDSSALKQVAGSREHVAGKPPSAGALALRLDESVTQRSKRITDAYAAVEPMCKWPAINGVVIKAIKSEKFTDDEIRTALLRLAAEGRSVTVETLRVELAGIPPGNGLALRNGAKPSTTDQRVAAAQALKGKFGGAA